MGEKPKKYDAYEPTGTEYGVVQEARVLGMYPVYYAKNYSASQELTPGNSLEAIYCLAYLEDGTVGIVKLPAGEQEDRGTTSSGEYGQWNMSLAQFDRWKTEQPEREPLIVVGQTCELSLSLKEKFKREIKYNHIATLGWLEAQISSITVLDATVEIEQPTKSVVPQMCAIVIASATLTVLPVWIFLEKKFQKQEDSAEEP